MKTSMKALTLVLCAVLLVCASVMGTLAYLQSKTEVVKNTFTVGNVQITLDEAKVDEYGVKVNPEERVQANTYRLLPRHTYVKDPTVTVLANSEACYVRMIVTVTDADMVKLMAAFPAATYPEFYNKDVFLLQNLVSGWDNSVWETTGVVTHANGVYTYEFRYVEIVARKQTANQVLEPLFTNVVIPGTLSNTAIAELNDVNIDIVAHAIQADGFANAAAAWAAWN